MIRRRESSAVYARAKVVIGREFPAPKTYTRGSLGIPEEIRALWSAWDKLPFQRTPLVPVSDGWA